jgi:mono/diheme cytochrome c family protein
MVKSSSIPLLFIVMLFTGLQVQSASGRDPATLYHDYCSVCHGDKGDGNSHAQLGLIPPPRDFTSPDSAVSLDQGRIIASITNGIPGTAMTPWSSQLTSQEIVSLAGFIRDKFMPSSNTDVQGSGRTIYADFCSVCHGDSGVGAMWAMEGLVPPPANFSDPVVRAKLNRERMIQSVSYGVAETAMTGWKERLDPDAIAAVVDYVRIAFMDVDRGSDRSVDIAVPTIDMNAVMPYELVGDAANGGTLYMANCATCHGPTGDGRGPRAYFINPKPRNFIHTASRATLNRPALFEAVAKGSLLSEMPAWDKVMTPQQIADVAEFVFQTYIHESEL